MPQYGREETAPESISEPLPLHTHTVQTITKPVGQRESGHLIRRVSAGGEWRPRPRSFYAVVGQAGRISAAMQPCLCPGA